MTTSPGIELIEADLRDEHAQVDEMVAPLGHLQWDRQTPAAGWAVRDQISHLAFFDDVARSRSKIPMRSFRLLRRHPRRLPQATTR